MGLMGRRAATASVLAALLVVSTAACDDGGIGVGADAAPTSAPEAPPTSEPETPPTAAPSESTEAPPSSISGRSDGVLTIGTLLPVTGPGNEIGLAGINAVTVGVRQIN
jgi:hypothetical protein